MGSKKSKSTTTVQLDPQTQALNELRLQQERAMDPLRAQGRAELDRVFNPMALLPMGTAVPGYTLSTGETLPAVSLESVYENLPGLSTMKFASPEEAFAVSRKAALTDVTGLERAAQKHLDTIIAPQLMSQAIAMGMGRSGAPLEATAKAGAQFALPIEQARMSALDSLSNFVASLGQRRQNLASGVVQPSAPFHSAPTQTTTTKQSGGGFMDFLLPGISLLAAPFTGGTSLLGMGASALGSLFSPASTFSGSPGWNFLPGQFSINR